MVWRGNLKPLQLLPHADVGLEKALTCRSSSFNVGQRGSYFFRIEHELLTSVLGRLTQCLIITLISPSTNPNASRNYLSLFTHVLGTPNSHWPGIRSLGITLAMQTLCENAMQYRDEYKCCAMNVTPMYRVTAKHIFLNICRTYMPNTYMRPYT